MLHTLWHALLDSLMALPVLFVVYLLLELLEYRGVMSFEKSKMLKGKASPVFGSIFGCIPQCGFSIVSTDLYSKKKLSIGALIAVFIATSDEAIPMMIADVEAIPALLLLVAIKIIMGVGVGYLAMFLYGKIFERNSAKSYVINEVEELKELSTHEELHKHEEHEHLEVGHEEGQESNILSVKHSGCCHHEIEKSKFEWKHPIMHSLKIFAFILVVNIVFGLIIHFVGEDSLIAFLNGSSPFQPLFAVLVGLIPNCASSVVITELYLIGGLSFGSIVAGLSVNAGLGLIVLFKQNKNWKENLFILLMLIIPSLLVGYALHFLI